MLPNAFFVGFPKCGSSTFYNTMGAHHDIFVPHAKEIPYFASETEYSMGLAFIESQYFAGVKSQRICLDCNPVYILSARILRRLKEVCPRPTIFIGIRNPIRRAVSHVRYRRALLAERRDIDTALVESMSIAPVGGEIDLNAYAPISRYVDFVQTVGDVIPDAAVHVLTLDEMYKAPRPTLDRVSDALGIDRLLVTFHRANSATAYEVIWRSLTVIDTPTGKLPVDAPSVLMRSLDKDPATAGDKVIVDPSPAFMDAVETIAGNETDDISADTRARLTDYFNDHFAKAPKLLPVDPMTLTI